MFKHPSSLCPVFRADRHWSQRSPAPCLAKIADSSHAAAGAGARERHLAARARDPVIAVHAAGTRPGRDVRQPVGWSASRARAVLRLHPRVRMSARLDTRHCWREVYKTRCTRRVCTDFEVLFVTVDAERDDQPITLQASISTHSAAEFHRRCAAMPPPSRHCCKSLDAHRALKVQQTGRRQCTPWITFAAAVLAGRPGAAGTAAYSARSLTAARETAHRPCAGSRRPARPETMQPDSAGARAFVRTAVPAASAPHVAVRVAR